MGAGFELCQACRRHGHIVWPDGFVSAEVFTTNDAWAVFEYLTDERGGISGLEAATIVRGFEYAGLPRRASKKGVFRPATRLTVMLWNRNRAMMMAYRAGSAASPRRPFPFGGATIESLPFLDVDDPELLHDLFASRN